MLSRNVLSQEGSCGKESINAIRWKNLQNRGQIGVCQGLGMGWRCVVIKSQWKGSL